MRFALVGLMVAVCGVIPGGEDAYTAEVLRWRADREARLKTPDGWLSVTGLFWLKEGGNTFGSGPANDIVLPSGAPQRAGVFTLRSGQVSVRMEGERQAPRVLRYTGEGAPDIVTLGDLSLFVIEREKRYAIRMRDRNSRLLKEFTGLHWYPVKPAYRVTARFLPHPQPKPIEVPSVIGYTSRMMSPGVLEFRLNGKPLRLEPVLEGDSLFIIFKDRSSGRSTYGAGRFLYARLPRDGRVELDFNKAYNPPCAFTPYATCPLPPKQNRLDALVEAGEMNYHHP